MKGKLLTILTATALITIALAFPAEAAATFEIYGYTDKIQYMPGESGKLNIWIYNDGTDDLILKSITIEYPWHSDYIWEGNDTIKDIDTVVAKGANWSTTRSFTIPNDGRATSGNIKVSVVTDKVSRTEFIYLDVASAAEYFSLQSMDKIVTLLTIIAVLVIVCTIIVAATIFLSARRPQITWKTEEKAE